MPEPTRFPVPARVHRVEDTERRSRFITTLARAPDAEAAQAFVARIREELPDATHHCWAFVAGAPGSTAQVGMSDDGEPHGTAGRPMLTALLHGGVGEVVAVVSRYFGGVKLGTGGLGRAYARGVKHALDTLPTVERVDRRPAEIAFAYADVDAVRKTLEALDVLVVEEAYGEEVRYRCAVPAGSEEAFRRAVTDATRGEARVRGSGEA